MRPAPKAKQGLSNIFIEKNLYKVTKKFKGVFSSDNIPNKLQNLNDFSIICNLSKENEIGTHFITILVKDKEIFILDSLGDTSIFGDVTPINKFLKKVMNRRTLYRNSQQLQSLTSQYCGFYCIYFVLLFEKNSLPKFQIFSKTNLRKNDSIVIKEIKKLLKK